MTSSNRMKVAWNGPVDMNEDMSDQGFISILQYWDVTSPPSKAAKFRSKRHRRISLEMHGPKGDDQSVRLKDILPTHLSSSTCTSKGYKSFFRISKYAPKKSGKSHQDSDNESCQSSVTSDVSVRTKDMYSKPDHEWRTKMLLEVSRMAITNIKKEKTVYFELWRGGEAIERSLTFKSAAQAKDFSYNLERLANEELSAESAGGDSINTIKSPKNLSLVIERSSLLEGKHNSTVSSLWSEEDVETGSTLTGKTFNSNRNKERQITPITHSSEEEDNHEEQSSSSNRCGCCACIQNTCRKLAFLVANIQHFIGFAISISLFFYAVAITSIETDPEIKVAEAIMVYCFFIALTHGTGTLGINEVCCSILFLDLSCVIAVLNVILNGALLIIFSVRKDGFFTYLKNHHDKLFISEDDVERLTSHSVWIYWLLSIGCLSEITRFILLKMLKRGIKFRQNDENLGELSTPLMQGS